jgi:hypothetical protein
MMINYSGSDMDVYQSWSKIDLDYIGSMSMTGIYQCYCQENMYGFVFGPLVKNFGICSRYTYFALFGGHLASMPFGILVGALNNIGAWLVTSQLPKYQYGSIQQ